MVRSPELPVGRYPEIWLAWLPAGGYPEIWLAWLPAGRSPDPCRSWLPAGRSPDPFMKFFDACRFLVHVSIYNRRNTTTSANIDFKVQLVGVPKKYRKKGTVNIFAKSF